MARFEITGPDGRRYEVTAPDNATEQDVLAYVQKNAGQAEPPAERGFMDRAKTFGSGMVRGARDLVDSGAQNLLRLGEASLEAGQLGRVPIPRAAAENALPTVREERQKVEAINQAAETDYQQNGRDGTQGFDWGRLTGNVVAAAPLAAGMPSTIAAGATTGAVAGGMQPVYDTENFVEEKTKQTGFGALGGAGGSALAKFVGGAILPQVQKGAKSLYDAGVRPTIGQTLGGTIKRVEDGLASLPVLGDAVKRGQMRSMEQFNIAAVNKALAPIGEKLSKGTPVGREAIEEAGTKLSQAYDDVLPKLTFQADQPFFQQASQLLQDAKAKLPAELFKQLDDVLKFQLGKNLNPNTGRMSGETLKVVESELGRLGRSYGKSAVSSERELGNAFQAMQGYIREALERSNPTYAPVLKNINQGYSKLLRVERAAGSLGAKDGVFTGAQLTSAVKALDPSRNKRAFARGNAPMQEFAETGKDILGQTVPDSGTPYRMALGAGAAGYVDPMLGGAAVAGMAPYTSAGQNIMSHVLMGGAKYRGPVADAARALSPYAAAGAGVEAARARDPLSDKATYADLLSRILAGQ